jgi:spore coat protein U-like protein
VGSASAEVLPPESIRFELGVLPTCTMTTVNSIGTSGNFNFLSQNPLWGNDQAIEMRCNAGTTYSITPGDGFNLGADADYPTLRALGGPRAIGYELFQDSGAALTWSVDNPITGVGRDDGLPNQHPVYIQAMGVLRAYTGDYSDQILVSATFN